MRKLILSLALWTFCAPALPVSAQSTPAEQLAAASALFDAKKYAEAAAKLDVFLTANPKHPKAGAAALALGRARTELKQYDKAIPAYEKAIASKESDVVTTAQLLLGEAAMQTKQWDKAADALGEAVKSKLKPEQAVIAYNWLGQAHFQLQRYPEAEQAYLKVITDFRSSDFADSALFGAALAALRQNKEEVAKQRFRTLVERYPKSEDRLQSRLLMAQLDLKAKRYNEARDNFEAVLADNAAQNTPGMARAAEDGLIQTLLELEDFNAAAKRLESAIANLPMMDPQRFRAQLSLGHSRYRQKLYPQALTAYTEAAKSNEEAVSGEALYWQGNALLALDRPAEAAPVFGKFVTRSPKHTLASRALLKQADALAVAKQPDGAADAYRTLVARYPQSPEAETARKSLTGLTASITDPAQLLATLKNVQGPERMRGLVRAARLYLTDRQVAKALPLLEEVTKASPPAEIGGEANYLLGLTYETQSKPALAVAALTQAVKLQPDADWAREAQDRLPALHLDLKQPANAEKAALDILARKPEAEQERQTRLILMQAYLDQKKWDPALEVSQNLLDSAPPQDIAAVALFTQAYVREKQEKPEEALPVWEKLAAEHAKSEYAPEALLRIGDARLKAEKYEEAQEKYAQIVNDYPDSPLHSEARFKRGSALYNQQKYAEAATEYEAVAGVKKAGDYQPEALYWAGLARDKSGEKDAAITHLTRLVTEFPKHTRVANAKIRLAALKAVKGN